MQEENSRQVNSQNWPTVAIIILNWNGWHDTLACLESLQKLTYPRYLMIVVDNGSQDNSVEKIEAWSREKLKGDRVVVKYTREIALLGGKDDSEESLERASSKSRMVLIQSERNMGFAEGNNVAIHYALNKRCPVDYVFLLNNDALADSDCLTHLVSINETANAGIVAALVKDGYTGNIQSAGYNGSYPLLRQFFQPITHWPDQPPGFGSDYWTCFWVIGAAMLIRRSTLADIYTSTLRYFDSKLFLYGEDLEFCCMARKVGYKTITAKHAVVYHKAAHSSGGQYNPISYYYSNRNRVFLANDLLSMPWKALFHPVNVIVCFIRILKNAVQHRPASAYAIFCALVDGYTGVTGKWKYHDREALRYHAS